MKKVTLIIGAGANKEINPKIGLGIDLIKEISDRVTDRTSPNNPYLSSLINDKLNVGASIRENFLIHLDHYISNVKFPSIDSFLDEVSSYPEFVNDKDDFINIGRVLIIAHVLGYEGSTNENTLVDEVVNKRTWFSVLGDFIESKNLLKSTDLKIVTFNYDRILEYFLVKRFGQEVKTFIKENVIHVYGRIGYFQGVFPESEEQEVRFGLPNDQIDKISQIQNQIKLIHQRSDTSRVKNIINESEIILAFGYGLDSVNNKRLALQNSNGIFHFNIYPGVYPNFDFAYRRFMTERIRDIVVDANIHYKTCAAFVQSCLSDLKS